MTNKVIFTHQIFRYMKFRLWIQISLLCCAFQTLAQRIPETPVKKTVYLIPGQGSDGRLFQGITIEKYDTVHIRYLLPEKYETLQHYAGRIAAQIDTSSPYSIVGVSLGGIIATELAEILSPESVIIISSAKCKQELPTRYKLFKVFPLYKIIGGKTIIRSAKIAQPLFEPTDKATQQHFKNMINQKDPYFMQRAVTWIVTWEREDYSEHIVHIHGTKDHTLPFKHVQADVAIERGTHLMTMTRSTEISNWLNFYLQ